jgi:hypothetical protein
LKVSEPKVIYLGPACESDIGDGRTWAEDNPWPDCECGHRPVQYVIGETFNRMKAERDALQLRLNTADQRIDDLEKDKARLDAIEANFWDVRHHSSSLADTGDYTSGIEIIGHWMDKPIERVIGENYSENLRAAIDQAMAAPAYPPARPEYPDNESAQNADWHMNPCNLGHRDVGASGGVAHCYTCGEEITAATTQEAFEQWNATHAAVDAAPEPKP